MFVRYFAINSFNLYCMKKSEAQKMDRSIVNKIARAADPKI